METVEYLVVTVTAYFVFIVNESVMYILSCHELRHYTSVLRQNGLQSFQLRLLFAIDTYSEAFFQMLSYIFGKKLEILIEYRLRGDGKPYSIFILSRERKFQKYPFKPFKFSEEFLIPVHIRRIQPYKSLFGKHICYTHQGLPFFRYCNVRIYLGLLHLFLGKLRIAVKRIDGFNLITKEGYSERIII